MTSGPELKLLKVFLILKLQPPQPLVALQKGPNNVRVSLVVLEQSLVPASVTQFHICHGQPLQISVREGSVVSHTNDREGGISVTLNTEISPTVTSLWRQVSDQNARIGLGPQWESNPQNTVFCACVGGLVKWTFSTFRLNMTQKGQLI